MKIIQLVGTILERHQIENACADTENLKAITDYNILMGNLEDPAEEEGEAEDNG